MIITISREYGSGGGLIGHKLADLLKVPCYDKTVAELTACISGFSKDIVRNSQDRYSSGFDHLGGYGYGLYSKNMFLPIYDQIYNAQSDAILQLAAKGDCVIVGRCSSHILEDANIKAFNVFIYAPLKDRIKRVENRNNLTEKESEKLIKKNDAARRNYYRKYAHAEWGKPQNYHLAINSTLGIETVTEIIAQLAKSLAL